MKLCWLILHPGMSSCGKGWDIDRGKTKFGRRFDFVRTARRLGATLHWIPTDDVILGQVSADKRKIPNIWDTECHNNGEQGIVPELRPPGFR